MVAALAVSSPALWATFADSAPGAFDDETDFAANAVLRPAAGSLTPLLARGSLRVDCGTADPFLEADRAFVAEMSPAPLGSFPRGGHNADFWRRMAPAQLALLGRRLAGRPS